MPPDLYLTVEAFHYLNLEDIEELAQKRQQNYSQAPLCDLLHILDLERRIGLRNAKLDRLEQSADDLPF